MTKLLDNICKLQDILEFKREKEYRYIRPLAQSIFNEVHRHMARKSEDYSYELCFTSQDLRLTAKAISDTFKRWDDIMNPEKQIKKLSKDMLIIKEEKKKVIDMNKYIERALPIMEYRRDYTQILTELRSLLEHHSVFLYYLEEVSNDEFALKYTERLTKEEIVK